MIKTRGADYIFWGTLVLLVFLWGVVFYLGQAPHDATPSGAPSSVKTEGDLAPSFVVENASGEAISSETLKGKVVLLHFWATWCSPCKEELPLLDRLLREINLGSEFVPLLVSEDPRVPDVITPFRKALKIVSPIMFDRDFEAADRFGTYKIPETYLIDRDQRIVKKWIGPVDWSDPHAADPIHALFRPK